MSAHRLLGFTLSALCLCSAALAQSFPEGATTPTAAELKERLAGKVFSVKLADGSSWRLEYNSRGYLYVDTSSGFKGDGTWRATDGQLCAHLRGRDGSCNDVRLHNDMLHLKRVSGEIIQYLPR